MPESIGHVLRREQRWTRRRSREHLETVTRERSFSQEKQRSRARLDVETFLARAKANFARVSHGGLDVSWLKRAKAARFEAQERANSPRRETPRLQVDRSLYRGEAVMYSRRGAEIIGRRLDVNGARQEIIPSVEQADLRQKLQVLEMQWRNLDQKAPDYKQRKMSLAVALRGLLEENRRVIEAQNLGQSKNQQKPIFLASIIWLSQNAPWARPLLLEYERSQRSHRMPEPETPPKQVPQTELASIDQSDSLAPEPQVTPPETAETTAQATDLPEQSPDIQLGESDNPLDTSDMPTLDILETDSLANQADNQPTVVLPPEELIAPPIEQANLSPDLPEEEIGSWGDDPEQPLATLGDLFGQQLQSFETHQPETLLSAAEPASAKKNAAVPSVPLNFEQIMQLKGEAKVQALKRWQNEVTRQINDIEATLKKELAEKPSSSSQSADQPQVAAQPTRVISKRGVRTVRAATFDQQSWPQPENQPRQDQKETATATPSVVDIITNLQNDLGRRRASQLVSEIVKMVQTQDVEEIAAQKAAAAITEFMPVAKQREIGNLISVLWQELKKRAARQKSSQVEEVTVGTDAERLDNNQANTTRQSGPTEILRPVEVMPLPDENEVASDTAMGDQAIPSNEDYPVRIFSGYIRPDVDTNNSSATPSKLEKPYTPPATFAQALAREMARVDETFG